MTKFEDTADLFIADISPLKISREEFLAELVQIRLIEREKSYEDNFDRLLSILDNKIKNQPIDKYLDYLKEFSETSSVLYNNLLQEVRNGQDFMRRTLNE